MWGCIPGARTSWRARIITVTERNFPRRDRRAACGRRGVDAYSSCARRSSDCIGFQPTMPADRDQPVRSIRVVQSGSSDQDGRVVMSMRNWALGLVLLVAIAEVAAAQG